MQIPLEKTHLIKQIIILETPHVQEPSHKPS